MTINHYNLGDLISPATVDRAGTSDYPILSMTMHRGLVLQGEKFKKRIASADTAAYKVVKRGQLVVGFPIDEGVLAFQEVTPIGIVSPAYDVWNINTTELVQARYLERFLRSPIALSYYRSKLRSTTARRRSLPQELFLTLQVPVLEISEQKRVANILDQLDSLREKRIRAIDLIDDLAQSAFLDMFGDPVSDSGRWPTRVLGDLLSGITSGKSPTCRDRSASVGEWGVLKLGAITKCVYQPSENKALPPEISPDERYQVHQGDVLFSRKNTRELVAASAFVEETPAKLLLPDLIFRLEISEDAPLVPRYLHRFLIQSSQRRKIQYLASGSASSMVNISKARLSRIEIPLPPVDLQREFSKRIIMIEGLIKLHRTGLWKLDHLFESLQARAFRNEL
jgi:type I restriction enzyme S subunit